MGNTMSVRCPARVEKNGSIVVAVSEEAIQDALRIPGANQQQLVDGFDALRHTVQQVAERKWRAGETQDYGQVILIRTSELS